MRLPTLLLVLCLALVPRTPAVAAPPRVLLVVSSHGSGDGETRPGFEMDELSQAWIILKRNGIETDIASPAGGPVVADRFDAKKPYNAEFLEDGEAKAELAATLPVRADMAAGYQAIFLIGGKGAMFDFPGHAPLRRLLEDAHRKGRLLASVCHGPAALAGLSDRAGNPLVRGVRLTGFSNREEDLFGKRWRPQFPFDLETELRRRGAVFSSGPIMLPHVVEDGLFLSGQNPYSTAATAEALVRRLGRDPVGRTAWADEASMRLLSRLDPDNAPDAAVAIRAQPDAHDLPLIAIWGYYQSLAAGIDRAALRHGLAAMEIALPYVDEPQLKEAVAKARAQLATPAN